MAQLDLDDREFADFTKRIEFIPKAAADYDLQLLKFEAFETKTTAGWEAVVKVLASTPGKLDPAFDVVSKEGAEHLIRFSKIAPEAWQVEKNMRALREFLAACNGEAHTPQFKANKARDDLLKLDLSKVALKLKLSRRAWTKAGKGEHEGKVFVERADDWLPF